MSPAEFEIIALVARESEDVLAVHRGPVWSGRRRPGHQLYVLVTLQLSGVQWELLDALADEHSATRAAGCRGSARGRRCG